MPVPDCDLPFKDVEHPSALLEPELLVKFIGIVLPAALPVPDCEVILREEDPAPLPTELRSMLKPYRDDDSREIAARVAVIEPDCEAKLRNLAPAFSMVR